MGKNNMRGALVACTVLLWGLLQLSTAERALEPGESWSDVFAVKLHPEHEESINLHELGARHGLQYQRKANVAHAHVHLFRGEPTHEHDHIATADEVAWAERQIVWVPSKRSEDPLYDDSWWLHGNENSLNLEAAWAAGYSGSGVVVSIVDDGVALTHEEFANKGVPEATYDFNFDDADVTPIHRDYHGTASA